MPTSERTPAARGSPPRTPSPEKRARSRRMSRRRRCTTRASRRLVRPGTAFCSISSVGMPRSRRQQHDRARAVPADADDHRRSARRTAPATRRARSPAAAPALAPARSRDLPLSPALRIMSSAKPSRGITRDLDPRQRADEASRLASGHARDQPRAPRQCRDTDARPFRRRQSEPDTRVIPRTPHDLRGPRAGRCSAARPCRAG